MAALFGLRPVGKSGPVVQQGMIIDKLHVAGLQAHPQMHVRLIDNVIKQVERLQLLR